MVGSGNFVYFCKSDLKALQGHPRLLTLVPIEIVIVGLIVTSVLSALPTGCRIACCVMLVTVGGFFRSVRPLDRKIGRSASHAAQPTGIDELHCRFWCRQDDRCGAHLNENPP